MVCCLEIIVAQDAGFCSGVVRAVKLAEENAGRQRVVSWGPLIHNRQETERLAQLGITCEKEEILRLPEEKGDAILIRSHGVGPEIIEALEEKGWQIIDATCPFVKRAQTLARQATEEGYRVIILGDKDHAEVKGLKAWANNEAMVVASREELEGVELPERVAVLAQTTEKEERFDRLAAYLKERVPEVLVLPTICTATRNRQESAAKLAKKVDVMLVVGGRHSSNTNKLWEICRSENPRSYLIEEAGELNLAWLRNIKSVGITAGASTPAWIIKEVVKKMEENMKERSTNLEEEMLEQTGEQEIQPASLETVEVEAKEENETAGEEVSSAEEKDADKTVEIMEEPAEENEEAMQEEMEYKSLKPGDIVQGTVVKTSAEEVLVDIGGKSEGIIPANELSYRRVDPREFVTAGQTIAAEVIKEDKEGNIILSHIKARLEDDLNRLEEALETGGVITAPVTEVVKGGLLVDVGIRGFVPASHVERSFVEDLNQYLHKELRMKVLELDRKSRKAVLSQRAVLDEEHQKQKEALWQQLEEGQVKKGVVRRLTSFGAFVDIGGIDGLLHVSEMGWGRVNKPSDVVNEGDEIEVYILKVDPQKQKISLSLKEILPDPWEEAARKFTVGKIIEGTVVRIAPFGAFIEVAPGIDGLAHISQLSPKRVNKVEEVLSIGQKVEAKVIDINLEKKRLSLSLKEIVTDKEKEEYESFIEKQEEGSGVTIGEILKENNTEL